MSSMAMGWTWQQPTGSPGDVLGEDVADAAGVEWADVKSLVLLCHVPLAGGLADDLLLLPGEEGPQIEAGLSHVKPIQDGGQAVHAEAVVIHLEDVAGPALLRCRA